MVEAYPILSKTASRLWKFKTSWGSRIARSKAYRPTRPSQTTTLTQSFQNWAKGMDSHGRHLWGDRVNVLGQKTHKMCFMPVAAVLYRSSWPVPDSLKRLILHRDNNSNHQKSHRWSNPVKIFTTSLNSLIQHINQRKTSEMIASSNLKNWGMAVTLSPWLSCPTSQ